MESDARKDDDLAQHTGMLEKILQYAADGICVCHNTPEAPYVRFSHWNPQMVAITGYTMDEINRLGWYQTLYPDPEVRQQAMERMARMRTGDDIRAEEWTITRKDGKTRCFSISTSMIAEEDGRAHVLAVMGDVTDRVKAQSALRESEKKYRTLFENAPIGISIVDGAGNVLDANDAMFRLHGLSKKQTMPRIITGDYYHNRVDWEKTRARLGQDGFLNEWEVRLKKANGTPYDAIVTMRPIEIEGNSVWLAIIQNITEQRQKEQALDESLKEKELLLREIHHRVKNNMQIITSLLRLQGSKATHREFVDIMEDCQSRIRAMALVHETLYHSQALSHIGLLEYLQSLTGTVMQTYLHAASIAVRVSVVHTDMTLDPDKAVSFGLVISELLTNALKYAFPDDRSGTVAINAHRIGDRQLEVTVSDDGVGLPEDLDVGKTDTLGLELVTGLVERQLNGAIEWRVQNGTVFTIRFIP